MSMCVECDKLFECVSDYLVGDVPLCPGLNLAVLETTAENEMMSGTFEISGEA